MRTKIKKKRYPRQSSDAPLFAIIDAIATVWFMLFYSVYLASKSIITHKPIKRQSLHQQKATKRVFIGITLIGGMLFASYKFAPDFLPFLVFVAVLILIPISIVQLVRYFRRKALTSDIDKHLRKALKTMDSTYRWYKDENATTRELLTCLRAQGIHDTHYQYKLPNGRYADAKVGNMLIESKISPDTYAVDRLIGQLSAYTLHRHKVNIVIYGELHRRSRQQIEREIRSRYPHQVFLTALDNPQRKAQPNGYRR